MTDHWVTIYTFTYPHEAYVIRGKLESEGINCMLKDELTIQIDNFYSNALNGVKLQVPEEHAEAAKMIMKEAGYVFDEGAIPSKYLLRIKTFTDKIPLFNKIDFFWRLLFMLTAAIAVILIIFYFLNSRYLYLISVYETGIGGHLSVLRF